MSHHLPDLLARLTMAQSLTHKGILVVGPRGSGKSKLLWALHTERHYPLINVSLALAERLAPIQPKRRPLSVGDIQEELMAEVAPSNAPVLLDNLELLFDRSLEVDPHRLLRLASRDRVLVAAWPGAYTGGLLTYAYRGHNEFREWSAVDLQLFPL